MQLQHSVCLPARPQVSRGPFFRGSLRRGHTSPRAASCFGQTMTLAGTWCQLAAAVAKASTSCTRRGASLAPRICCWPPRVMNPTFRHGLWAPLNSVIPSSTDHTRSVCLALSKYPEHRGTWTRVQPFYKHLSSVHEEAETKLGPSDTDMNKIYPINSLTDSSVRPPSALQELRVHCQSCPYSCE